MLQLLDHHTPVGLDEERSDPGVPVGRGAGEDRVQVAHAGVGDPALGAGEHPVLAVARPPWWSSTRRRCRRRARSARSWPATSRRRSPGRSISFIQSEPKLSTGSIPSLLTRNARLVDASTRASSSRRSPDRRVTPRHRRTSPGELRPVSSSDFSASQLAQLYSAVRSASAACGSTLSSAKRRTTARSSPLLVGQVDRLHHCAPVRAAPPPRVIGGDLRRIIRRSRRAPGRPGPGPARSGGRGCRGRRTAVGGRPATRRALRVEEPPDGEGDGQVVDHRRSAVLRGPPTGDAQALAADDVVEPLALLQVHLVGERSWRSSRRTPDPGPGAEADPPAGSR